MSLWRLQISPQIITASSSLLSGRVTPEQLCSYMQLFRSNWGALESHCGVLQLGLATAQTLRHPGLPRWDACLAFERLLLQVRTHLTETYYPYVQEKWKVSFQNGTYTYIYIYMMSYQLCFKECGSNNLKNADMLFFHYILHSVTLRALRRITAHSLAICN